jgi:hypothetical protein
MPKYHSANLSLEGLKNECTVIQNHDEVKLVHLQGVEVEVVVNDQNHFNEARYAPVSDIFSIPELVFIAVNSSEEAITAHSDMTADQGIFIFDEILYINGEEQRVFGYGVLN